MANEMMNRRNNMFDAMNDWFDFPTDFFNDHEIANIMQADVAEDDKQYTIKVDMPGMDKKNINLSYKDGILSIDGNRKTVIDKSDEKHNIIHRERSEGHVSRSFRLPDVVAKDITAKYDNGVLTIVLPKQTASDNGNSIQIN